MRAGLLTALQEHLCALYETPLEHDVMDFLVTDARIANALTTGANAHTNAERLLICQNTDGLDVSLYIDDRILAFLDTYDPYDNLDTDNLNPFLIALEGVSHFQYLIWNAGHAKQVTQLEMELQAEVDKFVTATMFFEAQGSGPDNESFHDSLFTEVIFAANLDAKSDERYRAANHYAGKYCQRLNRRFPAQHREPLFLNELRRFYRLPQNSKIRSIETGQ